MPLQTLENVPHVLTQILGYVRQPEPRPNAGANHHQIRQDDLATCMCVSVLFNQLTAPLLYRRVIKDDLPCLLVNLDVPAARAQIRSKEALLALTEHLSLEYAEQSRNPTYTEIFAGHQTGQEQRDSRSGYGFNEQLAGLDAAFSALVAYAKRHNIGKPGQYSPLELYNREKGVSPFDLRTLSICSILGGHCAVWTVLSSRVPSVQQRLLHARRYIDLLFVCWSRPRHVCFRGNVGPLSISSFGKMSLPEQHCPSMTSHLYDLSSACMEVYTPTDFVSEELPEWDAKSGELGDPPLLGGKDDISFAGDYVHAAGCLFVSGIDNVMNGWDRDKWDRVGPVPVRLFILPDVSQDIPLLRRMRRSAEVHELVRQGEAMAGPPQGPLQHQPRDDQGRAPLPGLWVVVRRRQEGRSRGQDLLGHE